MNSKKLKVYFEKFTALLLSGTMVFALAGCQNNKSGEDPEIAYIQMLDEGLDDYLKVTKDYTKAKDLYRIYPNLENLNNLKSNLENLVEKVNEKLQKKLGIEFYCFVYLAENGDITYTITDKNNSKVAYTHLVSADGNDFGEIESSLILNAFTLATKIPLESTDKWSDKDVSNFLSLGDKIMENTKQIFVTDFEISNGTIIEVKPKKLVKE